MSHEESTIFEHVGGYLCVAHNARTRLGVPDAARPRSSNVRRQKPYLLKEAGQ